MDKMNLFSDVGAKSSETLFDRKGESSEASFRGNDKSSEASFSKDNTNTNQGEDTQEINILEELAKGTIYSLSKLPPDTQKSVVKAYTNMMDILSNPTSEKASLTEILFQSILRRAQRCR